MNQVYIIFYISSIVISSLLTVLFINRKSIAAKAASILDARKNKREIHLKSMVKLIVLDYLEKLKNGEKDDIT
tara:strand:- start:282 stop:500 length:219 start_codon:yes stop_codon:yes gene_type:complete